MSVPDPALRYAVAKSPLNHIGKVDPVRVREAAAAFTMPKAEDGGVEPLRVNVMYGGGDTAVASCFEVNDLTFSSDANAPKPNLLYVFRSALRASVQSYFLKEGDVAVYTATDVNFRFLTAEAAHINPGALTYQTVGSNIPGPHGPKLFSGRLGLSDQHRGWWMDSSNMMLTITDLAGLAYLDLRVYRCNGREWITEAQLQFVPGGLSVQFTGPAGYYSFAIFAPADVGAPGTTYHIGYTMTIKYLRNTGDPQVTCYGHRTIPGLLSILPELTEFRITAASGMITNKAALLQQGGQVAGIPLPEGEDWLGFGYDRINKAQHAFIRTALHGIYAWVPCSQAKDWDVIDEWLPTAEDDDSLVGVPGCSDAAFIIPVERSATSYTYLYPTGTSNQAAYFTVTHAVEFRTTNQFFDMRPSPYRREELTLMKDFVSRLPIYYSNDDHKKSIFEEVWSGIKGFANDVVSGVVKYGPAVLDAAGMLLPFLV